jgi:integrase
MVTLWKSKRSICERQIDPCQSIEGMLLTKISPRSLNRGISEYVFFNPQRPSTYIRSVKTAWYSALKLAGLPRFPIYQCRHSYATRLAAAGVSDTIIDQLLGHSRGDVLRFYTARVPEYLRDAIMRLDQLRSAKTDLPGVSRISALERPAGKGSSLVN